MAIADTSGTAATTARRRCDYIDREQFALLFRRNGNNRNRQKIADGIGLIARNFVRKFYYMPAHWRDDAASEATLLGIRKIWHYQTRCNHKNPFGYFTHLVQMKVWEQFRSESRLARGLSPWGREAGGKFNIAVES